MRKSANGQSLIKAKPQAKTLVYHGPLVQPPTPPVVNLLAQSIAFKLQ